MGLLRSWRGGNISQKGVEGFNQQKDSEVLSPAQGSEFDVLGFRSLGGKTLKPDP